MAKRKETRMVEIRYVDSQEAVQSSYDEIYDSENEIRHTAAFYNWILDLVDPEPGQELLDVACGEGDITRMARRRGVMGCGFDLSFTAVNVRREKEDNLLVANGETLPFGDGRFDHLTNIGSLEHYVNPLRGVEEMARVLKPGGRAVILLPNLFSVVNLLYARRHGRTADDGYQPIQRLAARYEWQELLEAGGLRVARTVKYEQILPKTGKDWQILLKRPKNLIWLALTPFIPLNLANSFVYICQKV